MNLIVKNCLTTFKRFKTATLLNVVGLSVAFAVFMVIATQIRHEFTYDTSYHNADHIYRLQYYDSLSQSNGCACGVPMMESIAEKIPGIENFGAVSIAGRVPLVHIDKEGNRRTYSEIVGAVTPGFMDIFTPEIIAGNARAALENVYQCIIPCTMAQRIFGSENPVGKTLLLGEQALVVAAVYRDFPKNGSLTNALYQRLEEKRWDMWSYLGFFQLTPGVNVEEINRKINESDAVALGVPDEDAVEALKWLRSYDFSLKPMKDIYFSTTIRHGYGEGKTGSKTMSYVLMMIGLLIMVIGYVNFTNFSTALAPIRIKNINTQRVVGASQGVLRGTLMLEAATLSLFSFLLSLLWVYLFSNSALSSAFFDNPALLSNIDIVVGTGLLSLVTGGLAGAYPAFYMTSFQPALILKGSFALTPQGIRLRNTLITLQFFTAMILITGALFIKLQHDYMRNRPIGMEREHIVMINIEREQNIVSRIHSVAQEIMENPQVYDYTTSSFMPGSVGWGWGRDFDGVMIQTAVWPVAFNFLRFFGIPVVEGADFFEENAGMIRYIFNQRMVDKFGLEHPIGKSMEGVTPEVMGTVVGISANVNFAALHTQIEPLVFLCGWEGPARYLFFKIDALETPVTLAHIKKVLSKFSDHEIDLRFLDKEMDKLYKNEANLSNIITLFSLIAIIISLMG
ncbi:MAG: hypothetical protein FWG54_01630, partial [Bacteroidetes bacterium]|nr:hypothetical protein [Bacteroidota bacterium]